MKKLITLGIMLLIVCPLFALRVTPENYKEIIGKHFVFVPEMIISGDYEIGNKKFNTKKYAGAELLIKDISESGGVFDLLLIETDSKGKTKEIKINAKGSSLLSNRLNLRGVKLAENLDAAKEYFIGKSLFRNSSLAKISKKSTGYSGDEYAEENVPYTIVGVEWSKFDSSPYRLMLDEDRYISAGSPNKMPLSFTDVDPNKPENNYKVSTTEDKLENATNVTLTNLLKTKGGDKIYFELRQYTKNGKKSVPSFSIGYVSDSWLFADSASLYIDGKVVKLDIGKRDSDVWSGGTIFESFYFNATKQQILDIINAKAASLRIYGQKGYVDGEFTEQNFYNFKRFYNEQIK